MQYTRYVSHACDCTSLHLDAVRRADAGSCVVDRAAAGRTILTAGRTMTSWTGDRGSLAGGPRASRLRRPPPSASRAFHAGAAPPSGAGAARRSPRLCAAACRKQLPRPPTFPGARLRAARSAHPRNRLGKLRCWRAVLRQRFMRFAARGSLGSAAARRGPTSHLRASASAWARCCAGWELRRAPGAHHEAATLCSALRAGY